MKLFDAIVNFCLILGGLDLAQYNFWAGLNYYINIYRLSDMNDNGKTFDEIADFIEEHWKNI